jgi:hypothetical protein
MSSTSTSLIEATIMVVAVAAIFGLTSTVLLSAHLVIIPINSKG